MRLRMELSKKKEKKTCFDLDEDIHFLKGDGTDIITSISGKTQIINGIEPFVSEEGKFTNIIGIMSKSGTISKECFEFINRYKDKYKFVYLVASGPYFEKHYKQLYDFYDAVARVGNGYIDTTRFKNTLKINYSMMARSGPTLEGFFWESDAERDCDYSILTWYGSKKAKKWKDAKKTIIELGKLGYKGIVVTQRGTVDNLLSDIRISELVKNGLLEVYNSCFSEKEFHELMCRAWVGIFPNQADAFPKHLIETVLADKGVVVSPYLFMGKEQVCKLGSNNVLVQDFSEKTSVNNIAKFIDQYKCKDRKMNGSTRKMWLDYYDFEHLSREWADEVNSMWGTSYKRVCLLRHEGRFF